MHEIIRFKPSTDRHTTSALRFALALACLTLVDGISYVCLFPSYLRPGSDYSVSVTLFQASSFVQLQASFTSPSGSVISSSSSTANATSASTLMTLSIPVLLSDNIYNLKIIGTGGLTFTNSANVKVFKKTASVFIQTDKAVYRPGQKVLFRVVAIYPTMKPYTDVMEIVISDNEDRKMGQWKHTDPRGVFSGELQLSTRTPLGTWRIEVLTPTSSPTIKSFEVTEYELPKFEVIIDSPLHYFLLVNKPAAQQPLRIPVTAKHTYGEPVKGVAELSVSVIEEDTQQPETTPPTWKKTINLADGKVTAEVSPAELSSIVPASLKQKSPDQPWTQLQSRSISIVANVIETVTGQEISSSIIVKCHVEKYGLYFSNITSGSFKPGETYTGFLELKQKDGSEPTESDIQLPNKEFRQIAVSFKAGQACSAKVVQNNIPLTASGFVRFSFEPKDFNCDQIILEASFQDEISSNTYSVSKTIEKFKSKAEKHIRIDLDKMHLAYKDGDELIFNIKTSQEVDAYHYVVMSKGSIVSAQTVTNPSNPDSVKLKLNRGLAQQLAPRAQFVVWFVADNTEVISDLIEFYVEGAFANEVTVAFGKNNVEPGKPFYLEVRGTPGSVAFVLALDKSALLLKGGNDINQDMALDDLKTYDVAYETSKPRGKTSEEIFERSLLSYLTDGFVYSSKEASDAFQEFESFETFTRMCFPETWIWSNVTIRADGVGYLSIKTPDTITSWVASAFAIHEQSGLGIARYRSQVKVFLPLFVSMSVPRRVRNGEQFELLATVYNYLDSDQTVTVTLKASLYFDVQQRIGVMKNVDISRQITVPRKDASSVSFWIITTMPGLIPVVVSAKSGLIEDIENRTLLVVPEGVEQFYCTSLIIDLKKGAPDYYGSFKIEWPSTSDMVPLSEHLEVTVIGDILGASVTGIGELLKVPGGCGEQKMIDIAPVVYLLDYLEITKFLTPEIKAKFEEQLLKGYQQELTAQRDDKSFSAWGNNDTSGSVWLSAFVVKTFNVATLKNRLPVEKENLADTLTWIIKLQSSTGSFSEPEAGRVYHVEMQGGAGNGVPLTAYVLITLIENRNNEHIDPGVLERTISKTVSFLESQLDSTNDDYALCIVTYALVLAKSSRAGDALRKRDALAHVSMDQKHWGQPPPVELRSQRGFRPPYMQASAIDVEMTSYALLTYVVQKNLTDALPVVKWLLTQRNPSGGFVSTQDTVLALEALTRFASQASGTRSTVNLQVKATAGSQEKIFQPITEANVFATHLWEPKPAAVKTIDISASGFGKAIVQLNVRYNVRSVASIAGNGGINLDVKTEPAGNMVTIKTCASLNQTSKGPTGMALETIDPLSGYVPVNLNEVDRSENVKQIEVDGHQVAIYYEKLDGGITCTSVKMKKEFAILHAKNATVTCIDYYNPGNFVTAIYGVNEPNATWKSLCPTCDV